MCMVCAKVYVHHMCAGPEVRRGIRSPRTGGADRCETPCGCWDPHPGRLEWHPVLVTNEPSLPLIFFLLGTV